MHQHSHHHSNSSTNHEHFHTRFQSVKEYAQELDSPNRATWQKPEEIISFMNIPEHASIADIGAGTGYFSFRIAESYPDASITAIDVDPQMIRYITEAAHDKKYSQIHAIVSHSPEKFPAVENQFDRILLVNTLHHIPNRIHYIQQMSQSLQNNGQIIIVDFTIDGEMGPPPEHRLSADTIEHEMNTAEYTLLESADFLLPNQYCLRFAKSSGIY